MVFLGLGMSEEVLETANYGPIQLAVRVCVAA
jgi:hypothetical protein